MRELREEYEQIKAGQDVRQNLIALKAELKDKEKGRSKTRIVAGWYEAEPWILEDLLEDEDAKVRGNAAQILGLIGTEDCRDVILETYQREEQRYLLPIYLSALQGCDCSESLDLFLKRREELLGTERTEDNDKHIREELEQLNALIGTYEKPVVHTFTALDESVDVILTTWKEHREVTASKVETGKVTMLGSGVKVRGARVSELLKLRTWREMLFLLNTENINPEQAAQDLAASNLLTLLDSLCGGEGTTYRFRIEYRGKMEERAKKDYLHRLADDLYQATGGRMINDVSGYELELRLLETRSGGLLPLVKLMFLPDKRFSYRKHKLDVSMQPALAGILMELARPYMKENARVLDPFCGVGTLLLERNYAMHADTLYGVDSFGKAVAAARENAEIAGVPVHYINRNFGSFTHEYLFDEIVTDMPARSDKRDAHAVDSLYRMLFTRTPELLNEGGYLFIYAHDRGFAKRWIRETEGMWLTEEWQISEKEDTWFLAVRFDDRTAETDEGEEAADEAEQADEAE